MQYLPSLGKPEHEKGHFYIFKNYLLTPFYRLQVKTPGVFLNFAHINFPCHNLISSETISNLNNCILFTYESYYILTNRIESYYILTNVKC